MTDADSRYNILLRYGVDPKSAKTVAQSAKFYPFFVDALERAGITSNSDTSASNPKALLVYNFVTKSTNYSTTLPDDIKQQVLIRIKDERLTKNSQIEVAAKIATTHEKLDPKEIQNMDWDKVLGVGVEWSEQDIKNAVNQVLQQNKDALLTDRYRYPVGMLCKDAISKLPFVDTKIVMSVIDDALSSLLGPKTEDDLKPKPKIKKKTTETAAITDSAKAQATTDNNAGQDPAAAEAQEDPFVGIPTSMEARNLKQALNTPELLRKQKENSGNRIVTRFPPEPNGHLHIGHAKAMFLDFGWAKKTDGICILRFDDTNPEKEKQEYITNIIDIVKWLGHEPFKITYSSDYFDQLFELACELIRRGKAYVCRLTGEKISEYREKMQDSPWRDTPMQENLDLFYDMKKGKFAEGEVSLRMKIDMKSPNPVLRDPIAYRIRYAPHPHVGDKWCIYPSYDFTHCLVDSLEWVTHSLCTLEFEIRRDSYYWLLEALDLYRPFVWEFSRLNLEQTVVSKRKLLELIQTKRVRGWDDPRMPTLIALKRRGFPPQAINNFCAKIGVSRSDMTIGMHALEHAVRCELDATVPRTLAVLDPLKVVITNFPQNKSSIVLQGPLHPKDGSMGMQDIIFTPVVYIDRSDFRLENSKEYFGLAPGKTAMLRHTYPVTITDVAKDENGVVIELQAIYDVEKSVKPKGVLHWVPELPYSSRAEIRIYEPLFKSANPGALTTNYLDDINPESEIVLENALVSSFAAKANHGDRFQFERVGYFCCDTDSKPDALVFNRVVSLKDNAAKKASK